MCKEPLQLAFSEKREQEVAGVAEGTTPEGGGAMV